MYVYIYTYIYMYICIYICIYIYPIGLGRAPADAEEVWLSLNVG